MKTRIFVVIVVLSLILLVCTYSYAARKETTIDPEIIYSVLTGTWINRDYDDDDRNAKYRFASRIEGCVGTIGKAFLEKNWSDSSLNKNNT